MKRKEAIQRIVNAYDNKELQMFRGPLVPNYYNARRKDCCAVGAIMTEKHIKSLARNNGDVVSPYKDSSYYTIDTAMKKMGRKTFHGIKAHELYELQHAHDQACAGSNLKAKRGAARFKIELDKLKASVGIK